jgi:translocation and assembly module TamB
LPGGSLEAKIDSRVKWGKRSLPLLERDARAHIEARQVQLASLSPLIAREVSELAGLLNAHADLRITQQSTELTGNADVKNGVLQVPALGQRLSDIAARIVVADNRVRLEKLTAAGLTGRLEASGVAELDGFALTRAEADLHIARDEKIPVTLEGVAIGDASGDVHAVYVNHPTRPELTVDVPSFLLTTPETGGYGLQELERPSEVRVGVRRADGKFVSLPVQPLEPDTETSEDAPSGSPLSVRLRLGDVTVERGRAATAQLTGELRVKTGKPTSVNGRIEIKGGELDVQGKRFEIERGVVVFDGGDASNPTITATARWDSPTDHSVYAEYVGDVETGKIKLHSEPPLTQDEIVSLLLFGTLDGTMGTGEGNQASMAVTLAGGTVAQGLNRALSAFSNLDLSARVDTSTGSPRPELVFQVTPRVSAKVSRAVGVPSAGEAPDRTFLTLELRLQRAWALSAVFGDRGGSALDLIWRHRY